MKFFNKTNSLKIGLLQAATIAGLSGYTGTAQGASWSRAAQAAQILAKYTYAPALVAGSAVLVQDAFDTKVEAGRKKLVCENMGEFIKISDAIGTLRRWDGVNAKPYTPTENYDLSGIRTISQAQRDEQYACGRHGLIYDYKPKIGPYAGKRFVFTGVRHTQTAHLPTDITGRYIQYAFQKYAPDIVVIEMLPSHLGKNDLEMIAGEKEIREYVSKNPYNTVVPIHEFVLAIYLSQQYGIPFVGSEPAFRDVFKQFKDVCSYRDPWGGMNFYDNHHKIMELITRRMTKLPQSDNSYAPKGLTVGFYKKYQESQFTGQQDFSGNQDLVVFRDQHMVQTNFDHLKDPNNKTVLFVCGNGHALTQKNVLTQYLGEPTVTCLNGSRCPVHAIKNSE